jgi:murein L,D-transpeptidase YcbB/YkuD
MNLSSRSFIKSLILLILIVSLILWQTAAASSSFPADLTKPVYAAEFEHPAEGNPKIENSSLAEKNYSHLRDLLPLYQKAANYAWTPLSSNAKLKLGAKNSSVPVLRERLMLLGDLVENNGSAIFDVELLEAVKSFQYRHGLDADGVVGKETRAELNVLPIDRIRQIQVNMQRWANLSGKLKSRFIMVNVPDYELYFYDNDQKVLSMKTIVGKPERQTPEVFSRITTLVFNPFWNVPEKIARKDIVPKALADPNYLDQNNIRVYDSLNDYSSEIDDNTVDWQSVHDNGMDLRFRQDPGERNSLGLVKFEFPNTFDVYLHDTPAKELFAAEKRDFSSGCIRLEKPFDLVSYIMQSDPNWSDEKMDQLIAEGKTTYVSVRHPVPVIITYITAWVDEEGKINFRDDVYGRDVLQ